MLIIFFKFDFKYYLKYYLINKYLFILLFQIELYLDVYYFKENQSLNYNNKLNIINLSF